MLRLCPAAVMAALAVSPVAAADAAPSFLNDVMPVLTRQGCNQGACHGKGAGQNGFRLSLRGYAPDQDHKSITREFDGRRIDPERPDRSLFLLKAVGAVPHEGGKLFGTGGPEYRTLLRWIEGGSPGPLAADPAVTKLEVTPADRVGKVGDTTALTAWATFRDGTRRDVTWLTKFDSNDPGIASVAPGTATVTARRNGATAVRASFLTEVAVSTFAVPFERAVDSSRYAGRNNVIDDHVFGKLQALRVEPSDGCTDEEFCRRAFLDSIGTLPTPAEVLAFAADSGPDKRARLVGHLLTRPEFTDYWTLFLSDLFQNRKERDHDVRGPKAVRAFHSWLREQVAANRPWDALARDVLLATGDAATNPAVGYYVVTIGEHRDGEKSEAAESAAQAFLGTRIGCARCHNHPLEKYTQDDFYHFSAFFTRVKLSRPQDKYGVTTLKVGQRDGKDKEPVGVTQPRTGAFLKPQPLDRSAADTKPGDDPRSTLAAWITDPGNEYFAGAMVNRVWRHYLGVGLVEPVDDLRATNPPTNPALWKALIGEFVGHKYDLKHLMRLILLSRTYQLSSATRPGNEADAKFYSHYYARRLPAEVFLDAIADATGVPEEFSGYPVGVRAVQVPDPGVASYFLSLFGRSDRVTACACERGGDVTMPQLLHLQNGDRMQARLTQGVLPKLLSEVKDDAKLADELFLRTVGRRPGPAERAAVAAARAGGDPRDEVFRDVFWALLNSKDFAFNR